MMIAVINEMNTAAPVRNSSKYRRIAVGFRDEQLLKIFELGLDALKRLLADTLKFPDKSQLQTAFITCLSLISSCLSFDFIGTATDESADDYALVQAPSSWRFVVETKEHCQLLFDAYCRLEDCRDKALECLVQICSIRKSIFSKDTLRTEFLSLIMQFTDQLIQKEIGLEDSDNYHLLCRLLARFKSNYQLSEMADCKQQFPQWTRVVCEFTLKGFQSWDWSPNSIQYLLTFWSKISVGLSQGTRQQEQLEEILSRVSCGFIACRIGNNSAKQSSTDTGMCALH